MQAAARRGPDYEADARTDHPPRAAAAHHRATDPRGRQHHTESTRGFQEINTLPIINGNPSARDPKLPELVAVDRSLSL